MSKFKASKEVHRPLALVTPIEQGPDVKALQAQINAKYDHFKINRQIRQDGEFGGQTFAAATQVANCLGVTGSAQIKLKRQLISEGTQELIRGRRRTSQEVKVAKQREDYRKELRARYAIKPGELAVARGRKLIGVHEQPSGSNLGPGITEWQVYTGYTWVDDPSATEGVFWCGCYACWVVVKLGGAKIPDRKRLGYAPYITEDAIAGRNGLIAIPAQFAQPGDIACMWGGQHIEVVAELPSRLTVPCIGGNTSNSGKSNNGGAVCENTRSLSDFDRGIVARPAWK